jgi:hypothetical protein
VRIRQYRIGFCDVANPTNERALVASLIPPSSVCSHKVPTISFHGVPITTYRQENTFDWAYCVWLAVANSFAMDFIVRKKVSLTMSYTIMDSLPFPRLRLEDARVAKLMPLVLRLLCTGPEMADYWNAMASVVGFAPVPADSTPPGYVDPEERLDSLAQIEAIVAKQIFNLSSDEVDWILETFPIVKERDIARYGDYRTKILVLEHYDSISTTLASSDG